MKNIMYLSEIKFNPQLPVLDTGGFVDHRLTENWGEKNKTEW